MTALRTRAPRAMHVAEVCGQLDIPKSERDEVLDCLDGLVGLGLVTEMPGLRFRANAPKKRPPPPTKTGPEGTRLEGHLTVNPRAFGFVAGEDGAGDIFIPPGAMGAALHGDRVEVVARPSPKGREGTIVGIVRRRPVRITGTLRKAGRSAWLEPDDPRLRSPMQLVEPPPKKAKAGYAVLADIVHFPQDAREFPEVRIVDVLGVQGLTTVEVQKIKIREGVVEEFSEAVLEEATAFADRVTAAEKKGREDLRSLDLVTIDPATARDHDDALFAETTKDGGFRIVVAIADVSHYVRPGTAIDDEARSRGVSIYLPDRAIPMLPPQLSTHLASLVPKKDRLCLGVDVKLGPNGAIRSFRYIDGVMRSGAKITYEGAARALGLTDQGPREPEADKRQEMLQVLLAASRALRKRRLRRGALDFDLPEAKIMLDHEGVEPVAIERSRKDPGIREAYRLVEEMMLLANEVVAADLTERAMPAIYRIHGKPDEAKLELFAQLAASLGFDLDPEDAQDPRKLARFLKQIDGTAQASVLRYLLLRAMQQAVYDIAPKVGHFGLAAKDYLHFTSPIRRYPDLAVHRIVRKVARGERIDAAAVKPSMRRAAVEASRLERRAMSVERDVVNLYRAIFMRDRVGEEFEATISGATESGFYAAFDDPFVEAFVPVARLDDDYYTLDRLGIRLSGLKSGKIFTLGDRVKLRLEHVDIAGRELRAVPADVAPRAFGEGHDERDSRDRRHSKAKPERGTTDRRGAKPPRRTRRKSGGTNGRPTKRKGSQGKSGGKTRKRR